MVLNRLQIIIPGAHWCNLDNALPNVSDHQVVVGSQPRILLQGNIVLVQKHLINRITAEKDKICRKELIKIEKDDKQSRERE